MVYCYYILIFMIECLRFVAWGSGMNISCTNVNFAAPKTNPPRLRILGADEASHEKYRFVVAIMKKDEAKTPEYEYCSGAVVTSNIVLTACHCVGDVIQAEVKLFDPRLLRVIAGTENLLEDSPQRQILGVRAFQEHPKCKLYDPGTIVETDAALVMLKGSFEYGEFVMPMSMPENEPKALRLRLNHEIRMKRVCYLPGYGYSSPGTPSTVLREAKLQLISDYSCRKIFCEKLPTSDYCIHDYDIKNHFCAVPTDSTDGATPCKGDSGAPLVCDGYVFGLLIFGGCRPEFPVVMVKGSSALELIKMYSKQKYGTMRRRNLGGSNTLIEKNIVLYKILILIISTVSL